MVRKVIVILILGFSFFWASTVSAKACGFRHGGFVSPFGWGCSCSVFFSVGTHLGLGPGYPGLTPHYPGFNHWGLYAIRYRLPQRIPSVTAYTIRSFTRIHGGQRNAASAPIAKDDSFDPPRPAKAVIGRNFRRPAPAPEEDANNGAQSDDYIPRLCYRGECYEITPEEALSSDAPLGIIIWEPKN